MDWCISNIFRISDTIEWLTAITSSEIAVLRKVEKELKDGKSSEPAWRETRWKNSRYFKKGKQGRVGNVSIPGHKICLRGFPRLLLVPVSSSRFESSSYIRTAHLNRHEDALCALTRNLKPLDAVSPTRTIEHERVLVLKTLCKRQ